jgi:hypothetical protein
VPPVATPLLKSTLFELCVMNMIKRGEYVNYRRHKVAAKLMAKLTRRTVFDGWMNFMITLGLTLSRSMKKAVMRKFQFINA